MPDVDLSGDGAATLGQLHLEFMLKTVGSQSAEPVLVQRRYRDFDRLHAALGPIAKSEGAPLPTLPTSYTFGRNITEEFANQRQAALQHWLSLVVARPPLWCDPLRLFLGLVESSPTAASTPFRHSHAELPAVAGGGSAAGEGSGGGGGGGGDGGGASANNYSAELRWVVSRAQQPECGVVTGARMALSPHLFAHGSLPIPPPLVPLAPVLSPPVCPCVFCRCA